MLGLTEMHRQRDRHFGNGRAVRNLFEQAIRRMANRIADVRELTAHQLELLETSDIEFEGMQVDFNADSPNGTVQRFNVTCPKCGDASKSRGEYLGKKVTCPKCKAEFLAEWGEPVGGASPS
jgi:ribosomal protein S27AE